MNAPGSLVGKLGRRAVLAAAGRHGRELIGQLVQPSGRPVLLRPRLVPGLPLRLPEQVARLPPGNRPPCPPEP